MPRTVIAVDLAKTVFEIAVSRRVGKVSEQHRVGRNRFLQFFAERKPATVVMEACGSAHHWARQLTDLGHEVKLLPPAYVRPYVQRNKTDRTDARGLLEALRNEDIRPVPVKSVAQQTLGAIHRLRSAWLAARTARINGVRGLLRELGLTIPVGARHVLPQVGGWLADPGSGLPEPLRAMLSEACEEIRELSRRIKAAEAQLEALARETPAVARLRTIPGVGLLTSTALVAFVGDPHRFPSCRHFGSYLGLTPHEHSSGLRRRLGGISKRGDGYLRLLLVHGARSVQHHSRRLETRDALRGWALALEERRGHNRTTVALANKLARVVWAVWRSEGEYVSRAAA